MKIAFSLNGLFLAVMAIGLAIEGYTALDPAWWFVMIVMIAHGYFSYTKSRRCFHESQAKMEVLLKEGFGTVEEQKKKLEEMDALIELLKTVKKRLQL
jgi:hypothetical protein